MSKTSVQVELSHSQEIELMNRYGRRCSRETLVKRAIGEILKQQAEDIPLFVGREEHEARKAREEEEARKQDEAKRPPPPVEALLSRFRGGEKFVDLEGREVTALELNSEPDAERSAPLVIQVDHDNSEWFPIWPAEIKAALVCTCGQDGKLVSLNCPVPAHAADAAAQAREVPNA